jgi:sec-independent protein translocase protein TatC
MRKKKPKKQPLTLIDHLRELRNRLFFSFVALVVTGFVVFFFYADIIDILRAPLGAPLYYSNPAGSFSFVLQICLMGAIAIAIPVLIYNVIMFIKPALGDNVAHRKILIVSALSSIFAIFGVAFAYFMILPGSLNFFEGFQVTGLDAWISADSYLGFVTNIIITFVLVFQIPLLIFFIDIVKPIPPKQLWKFEKWVILGSLIVALFVPFAYDLTLSLMVIAPIFVLYNLGFIAVLIRHSILKQSSHVVGLKKITRYSFSQEIALTDDQADTFAREIAMSRVEASPRVETRQPTSPQAIHSSIRDSAPNPLRPHSQRRLVTF